MILEAVIKKMEFFSDNTVSDVKLPTINLFNNSEY